MALNFGEVFLRESGAAQDRAQSMAEMQLRAKQFADNMAMQEANLAIAKRAQTLAEESQEFTQERLEKLDNLSEEDRKYYQEFVRPLELEKLENDVQQAKYQSEFTKIQIEDANAVMPDNLAEQLGMQKGTKWTDAEKILMGRQAVMSAKMQQNMLDATTAQKQLYSSLQAYQAREIQPKEFKNVATPEETIGGIGRLGRRIVAGDIPFTDTSFRDLFQTAGLGRALEYLGGPDEEEFNLRTLQLQREADLGVTSEAMLRLGGENRISLLDPLQRSIYQSANALGLLNTNPELLNQQATNTLFSRGAMYPGADPSVILNEINQLVEGVTPSEE